MTTVAVVVPTLNSATTLRACLESLRAQTYPCQIVVVDNHSRDDTQRIARAFADQVLVLGPERSAQRNAGAAAVRCDILGFIDSDMTVGPTVVEEVVKAVAAGVGAVVVPEVTVGVGFWASVRAFERNFYRGDPNVEAARFFLTDLFRQLHGFDESLDPGPEDWDLSIRAAQLVNLGRTRAGIEHNEGHVTYRAACARKGYYAVGLLSFSRKHGTLVLGRALNRRYLRRPWQLLVPHPLLGLGLVALKGGETVAVGWELTSRWKRPGGGATGPSQADGASRK